MCEEVYLFSVGSALNTRVFQALSAPYCQSEEKELTGLEKYGMLARTEFICQLFRIAEQNVSNTTPKHVGKPYTFLNFGLCPLDGPALQSNHFAES